MESAQSYGKRIGILCLYLGMFLLLSGVTAEDRKNPTANVNLAPFEQWRSAYFCLLNTSSFVCPKKHTLTMSGWLNVTHEEGNDFCEKGCADHTVGVLDCIRHVKRDFWFANKATVRNISDTIDIGCNTPQGFNGTSLYPTKA